MEPFVELAKGRPTVVHVRTNTFSDRSAPFIRQTVLGLRPYFRNVVVARATDCENPSDLYIETYEKSLRDPVSLAAMVERLQAKYESIAVVMGHMGNGTREGYLLARGLGMPFLGSFGGSDVNVEFDDVNYRERYQQLLESPSAHFVTVADYLRDRLVAKGVPAERLFVWHRGVNLDRFPAVKRNGDAKDRFRIAMSARFYDVKGHRYALEAFAQLKKRHSHAEISFVGNGPLLDQMKAYARELGVDGVHFVGHVPHREVPRYLRDADVYIQPSVKDGDGRTEGVPNAIMEAGAMGLPVVATDHGGIPEVVREEATGFLVPERDAEALADRLDRLARDPALRLAMGARGRELIEDEFNLDIQAKRLAARLCQLTVTADLFRNRGWPLYRSKDEAGSAVLSRQLAQAGERFTERLLNPMFRPKQKVVGPLLRVYKTAVWSVLIKPYIRFVGRELTASFADVMVQTAGALAETRPRAQEPEIEDPSLVMNTALCLDCPKIPTGHQWSDEPCPLDSGCLETLDREFAVTAPTPPPVCPPEAEGWLTLGDDQLEGGRIDLEDGSADKILIQANLQSVADLALLFRELRRVLRPDGQLSLQVWPLPGGRDGGLLMTPSLRAPFALQFFPAEVLERHDGDTLPRIRWFDSDDLRRIAAGAGFVLVKEQTGSAYDDPCEMALQARFAALFRQLGRTRDQLSRAYVATFKV